MRLRQRMFLRIVWLYTHEFRLNNALMAYYILLTEKRLQTVFHTFPHQTLVRRAVVAPELIEAVHQGITEWNSA